MAKPVFIKNLTRIMLNFDALIGSSFYHAGRFIRDSWLDFSSLIETIQVRGVARLLLNLFSDSLIPALTVALLIVTYALPDIKDTEDIWSLNRGYSIVFTDESGKPIGERGFRHNDSITLDEIPDHVIHALLATEDRRFYSHIGIDVIGTLRALAQNVRASGIVQGGSTLTQQLAKNLFLSPERSFKRKLDEAFLALWIEMRLSKKQILKLYLDQAYLGSGSFGVEAAAQTYFGKSIRKVNLAEAAILAGLYKAPSRYAPNRNLPAARARAQVVLDNMVAAGYLTEGEALVAKQHPAQIVQQNKAYSYVPDFFLDWAFEEVKRLTKGKPGQLIVKTTVDLNIQQRADYAITSALRQNAKIYQVDQAALVAVALDGAVKAIVGGRDYGVSQFNRATSAKRQPGSAFKPFVYLAALEEGFTPSTVMVDGPVSIGDWSPKNYGHKYSGRVTLATALRRSINTIPVKLSQEIGRRKIIDVARKLGIRSRLEPNRSLPLGTAAVSVLDMAAAYAVFANGGRSAKAYGVLEIRTQGGKILYDHARDSGTRQQLFHPRYIADLNSMLASVVSNGTGRRANLGFTTAAGKTGTTQSYRDAWFVGYTGELSAAIWFGNDNYKPTRRMTGGSIPAQTWRSFMTAALSGKYTRLPGTPMAKAGKNRKRIERAVPDDFPERLANRPDPYLKTRMRAASRTRQALERMRASFSTARKRFETGTLERSRRNKRPAYRTARRSSGSRANEDSAYFEWTPRSRAVISGDINRRPTYTNRRHITRYRSFDSRFD